MRLVLGPGASGTAASIKPYVEGLQRRGVEALAIDLPRGRAERAAPAFLRYAGEAIGGRSFGARAASLAAAADGADFPALVLLAYPLSGKPEERTAHWPRVRCPVIVINGTRDGMAPVADLQRLIGLLPNGRLELVDGAGHTFAGHLDDVLDHAAEFLRGL
ncbi:MAG TPA: alpha/beta fold hydrolase [Candidatus Dormibacteraeota bacterium]